jgi:hypothetical protein
MDSGHISRPQSQRLGHNTYPLWASSIYVLWVGAQLYWVSSRELVMVFQRNISGKERLLASYERLLHGISHLICVPMQKHFLDADLFMYLTNGTKYLTRVAVTASLLWRMLEWASGLDRMDYYMYLMVVFSSFTTDILVNLKQVSTPPISFCTICLVCKNSSCRSLFLS